ncbi:winged helix DNA-binding domain-containing protein [Streptomyces sp. NBC_01077]|uniref:winged helix DNA-binding domain-containing protein n=1 Tax=Streptomyces sp. NBC_01077 TaxID=2903746 RepID=UPI00386ED099
MGETRTIDAAERRARLGVRHRLAGGARAGSAEEVAGSLVALHGTDPASVFLAVGARLTGKVRPVADVERALYEDRSLVRMHGMRHTLFAFPSALAPAVQASTTDPAAVRERATLIRHLAAGSAFDAEWLAETERLVLAELAVRGEATGSELGEAVPALRSTYVYGKGTRQEGVQSVASRVLRVLGMEGRIVRGRPQGTWTSSRFRWTPGATDSASDDSPHASSDISAHSSPRPSSHPAPDPAEARAELIRRWLGACGPATEADLKWWTAWKVTDVRAALATVGALPVTLDEGVGFVLPDDLDPVTDREPEPEPWAALLPALDPTPMGWQSRDWYLDPEHRAALYDRSGNIGPTVWWNGRIVGGWAQRPDGEIVHRLLTDVGSVAARAIGAETERLAGWVGDVRVTPRFRTPLERELGA